jgi:hypothetical protein
MNDNLDLKQTHQPKSERWQIFKSVFERIGITDENLDKYFVIRVQINPRDTSNPRVPSRHDNVRLKIKSTDEFNAAIDNLGLDPATELILSILKRRTLLNQSLYTFEGFSLGGTPVLEMSEYMLTHRLNTVDGLIDFFTSNEKSKITEPGDTDMFRELTDDIVQMDINEALEQMMLVQRNISTMTINYKLGNYLMRYLRQLEAIPQDMGERVSTAVATSFVAAFLSSEPRLTLIPNTKVFSFVEYLEDTSMKYFKDYPMYLPNTKFWLDSYRKSVELLCNLEVDSKYSEHIKTALLSLLNEYAMEAVRMVEQCYKYYMLSLINPKAGVKILGKEYEHMDIRKLEDILAAQSREELTQALNLRSSILTYSERVFETMKKRIVAGRNYTAEEIPEYQGPKAHHSRLYGSAQDNAIIDQYTDEA